MVPFSVQLRKVYPVFGDEIIVTVVPALYEPDPKVDPPATGFDDNTTAYWVGGIREKLATNALFPAIVN